MSKGAGLFDRWRRHFEPGGRWAKLNPLFEAIETVFYAAADVTAAAPHVRDGLDAKRYLAIVVLSLVPLLVFGIYNAGLQARLARGLPEDLLLALAGGAAIVLPLVLVSYVVGFGWEILFAVVRGHTISEGVFVTAMLFPLTLPPTTPLWQAALGISFGVVIGKEIFGGTGRNFLNPALTGRAFLYFAYPVQMSGDAVWTAIGPATAADAVSGATPLAIAAMVERPGSVEAALDAAGYSLSRLTLGLYPDSIGASSDLLCLISALLLVMLGIANWRIIVGAVAGLLGSGLLLNLLATEASRPYLALNPIYHLVMGGAAFGIVFMATDPVSAPDTLAAKWIYGLSIGGLTVLIRVFNPAFPEGIMLAILFMNVFAPLLDHLVLQVRLRSRIPNV
jgi:Na+-transporting NADH:ubiquinone oxidoreductase subunit B